MMLILWPLDPRNRLFLSISNDHKLDLVILICNWSFGMPYDFLLLEMGFPGFVGSVYQGCLFCLVSLFYIILWLSCVFLVLNFYFYAIVF